MCQSLTDEATNALKSISYLQYMETWTYSVIYSIFKQKWKCYEVSLLKKYFKTNTIWTDTPNFQSPRIKNKSKGTVLTARDETSSEISFEVSFLPVQTVNEPRF